ncbi:hypothetical protein L3X38_029427 [Prunus dulcis]|uniref:KEN domain-containing protein n=1 Tax=Prunus dulcis TaxID=3755 RepID=A0AAD4VRL6_PRUDU|nr:hypothetical protein L3X38_029427 [Prunus dulcis]
MEVDRDLIDDAYIDYIKSQWRNNNSKDIVMGSRIRFYYFRIDYASGKQHYNGELFFKENKLGGTPVTFMNAYAKAGTKLSVEEIFRLNTRVPDERILRPWIYTFCKSKSFGGACSVAEENMVKGWWSLCYDKFDNTLNDWLVKLHKKEISDHEKFNLIVKNNCLSDFWSCTIRELIEAIAHIHDCGLFHGSLSDYYNYVVVGDQVKLFNIGGCLKGLSVDNQHSKKIQDFKDFRDFLKKLMPARSPKWNERDSFIKCFDEKADSYEKYVEKLKNHPFLLTPYKRVKYITGIYYDDKFGVMDKLNQRSEFKKFRGWTRGSHKLEPFLRAILESRKGKPYKDDLSELLRFLRNIYAHYRQYGGMEKIKEVDAIFRTLWVDFFDMIHVIT